MSIIFDSEEKIFYLHTPETSYLMSVGIYYVDYMDFTSDILIFEKIK